MKLWVDDVRPAPDGYVWCKSVNEAKKAILDTDEMNEIPRMFDMNFSITLIDIDHDAGEFVHEGGDYIKLLDWLEETGRNYPIHIHSQNVVGRMNMEAICRRNGWTEVSCSTCKFKNYAPYDEICARCENCNGWGENMNKNKEYIEREVVINELECLPDQGELDYLGVFDCVRSVPAADVEPVVHGEWIPIVNYFHGKPDGRYYCSVCHRVENTKGIYCRMCGARMDGGKK